MSVGVAAVNIAIGCGDIRSLSNCLLNSDLGLHSVIPECTPQYLNTIVKFQSQKASAGSQYIPLYFFT